MTILHSYRELLGDGNNLNIGLKMIPGGAVIRGVANFAGSLRRGVKQEIKISEDSSVAWALETDLLRVAPSE